MPVAVFLKIYGSGLLYCPFFGQFVILAVQFYADCPSLEVLRDY